MHRLTLVTTMVVALVLGCQSASSRDDELPPVVFVCEHGNVKSLIGATLFDQVAKQRRLPFRAVSRGVSPESNVPAAISNALRSEGVEVAHFRPQALSRGDMMSAARVIAIGVDLAAFRDDGHSAVEQWDDVPPASVDYAAARAALLRHINVLMDELASGGR